MTSNRLSRRLFLGGIGGSAALLPLLNIDQAKADAPKYPTRVVFVYFTNGVAMDAFFKTPCQDVGCFDKYEHVITSGFTSPESVTPLAPFEPKLIIPAGIGLTVNYDRSQGPVGGHDTLPFLLTGVDAIGGESTTSNIVAAGGESIDQYIARTLNAPTRFPSLETAVMVRSGNVVQSRFCWAGANKPVSPNENPYDLYGQLFADRQRNPADLAKLVAEQNSVLDHVVKQLVGYQSRVGGEDRVKIDSHLDAVRQLERQLSGSSGTMAACQPASLGSLMDAQDPANFPQIGQLQMDLLATALACDQTRVATLQWGNSANEHVVFKWLEHLGLGLERAQHHQVAHWSDVDGADNSDASHYQRKVEVDKWFVAQFAYLLGKLDSYAEGDGTLLDHTMVVLMNGMDDGGVHDSSPLPVIIGGGANGYLKTGRYLLLADLYGNQTGNKRDHRELLVSCCEAMGVAPPTFDGKSFSPLAGLRG